MLSVFLVIVHFCLRDLFTLVFVNLWLTFVLFKLIDLNDSISNIVFCAPKLLFVGNN